MNLEEVVKKLAGVAKELKADGGPLDLFGLFLREDSPELWDVVVAAPWLKPDERSSFERVARRLREALTNDELAGLSRVVILEHGGAVLRTFLNWFADRVGLVDIYFVADGGAVIRKAYVIHALPPESARRRVAKTRRRKKASPPPSPLPPPSALPQGGSR
jgi:hypothetical protein